MDLIYVLFFSRIFLTHLSKLFNTRYFTTIMENPSGEYSPFGCKKYPPRDDSKSQILTTRSEQPQPSSTMLTFLQRKHPEKYEAALKQAEKAKKAIPVTPPAPPKADVFVRQTPPSVPSRSPSTPPQNRAQKERPKSIRTVPTVSTKKVVEPAPRPIKETGDPIKDEAIRKFQAERDHQKKLMQEYAAGDTSGFSQEQLQDMKSTHRDLAQAIKIHGTGEQTTATASSEYKSNFHEFDYDN